MSIGRRSQEPQLAIMNSSHGGQHLTKLSQESLTQTASSRQISAEVSINVSKFG